jgi:hypothetical protein
MDQVGNMLLVVRGCSLRKHEVSVVVVLEEEWSLKELAQQGTCLLEL